MADSSALPALPDRTLLAADPHRPRFHFPPPAHWLNDPNGLIQWGETLHLFYQYNPQGPFHGTIHWGHASSTDLVHWKDHPIALAPTPGGPDQDGCWSGCAVDNDGTPTFVYTGVNPQTVCLATSKDGLETWQKHGGNPVIAAPPDDVGARCGGDFRDPYVWREADAWYMVIGSRRDGVGGLVLLYRSPDLVRWEFVRILLAGNEGENTRFYEGAMWECPNLLDFGERRALIISAQDAHHRLHHAVYFSGPYRNHEFAPDSGGVLAYGHSFYAPQATRLADGRIILFGWLREMRTLQACKTAGWNGAMSLPLVVSMLADGALRLAPAVELESLRREQWTVDDLLVEPGAVQRLALEGDSLELMVEFQASSAAEFGVAVCSSPDGAEQTRIVLRPGLGELSIERSGASADLIDASEKAPLVVQAGKPVQLHLFVDGSVLELFTDSGLYLATRIYRQRADACGVTIFATGAAISVKRLSAWTMASIW